MIVKRDREVPGSQEKEDTMATITQKNVLTIALNVLTDDSDRLTAEAERFDTTPEEVLSVLAHIVQNASKTSPRKHTVSKTTQENREFLAKALESAEEHQTITAKALAEAYELTSGKASAILRQGVKDEVLSVSEGKGTKVYTVL